jgi:hypothetical protein
MSPQDGGCWFCSKDEQDESLLFSMEFDTFYHQTCLDVALLDPMDEEARIINAERISR